MQNVVNAFKERKLYNHILNNYNSFSKKDLWTIIKELDFAIRETVSKQDYDEIYSYFSLYLSQY